MRECSSVLGVELLVARDAQLTRNRTAGQREYKRYTKAEHLLTVFSKDVYEHRHYALNYSKNSRSFGACGNLSFVAPYFTSISSVIWVFQNNMNWKTFQEKNSDVLN